jgi:hypothetical protein
MQVVFGSVEENGNLQVGIMGASAKKIAGLMHLGGLFWPFFRLKLR